MTGGGSAFWLLAYGLFYWASRLSFGSLSSVLLYLGYLVLLALLYFLVTGMFSIPRMRLLFTNSNSFSGTIGFLASYWAVRRLYRYTYLLDVTKAKDADVVHSAIRVD
jgi:transmembrane 9 superfamily protein 2/4